MLNKTFKALLTSYAKKIVKSDAISAKIYDIQEVMTLTEAKRDAMVKTKREQLDRVDDEIVAFFNDKIKPVAALNKEEYDLLDGLVTEFLYLTEGCCADSIYAYGDTEERYLSGRSWYPC